jgi:hypothetical protein
MDQAAQERAGGERHRASAEFPAVGEPDPRDAAILQQKIIGLALYHRQIGRFADGRLHRCRVKLPVRLGARPAHGRALAAVQDTELDAGLVGHPAHQSIQGVDLADQVPLAQAANGGIAGHRAHRCESMGQQGGFRPHAGRRGRSLAAGVATADDDDVEPIHGMRLLRFNGARVKIPRDVSRETKK